MEEGLGRATEGTWVGGGGFREGYTRNMGWWRIYLLICHCQDL